MISTSIPWQMPGCFSKEKMSKALAKKVVKDFKKADGKNDVKLLKQVLKKDVKKK